MNLDINAMTASQLDEILQAGELMADCPVPGCDHSQWMSPDDPDGSFGDLLSHINIRHPEINRDPVVLWPTIKYRKED